MLQAVVQAKPRWGFWKCHDRLRLDGHGINHKHLWRVYCQMGLNLPKRTKKHLVTRERVPLQASSFVNEGCALDFVHDVLYDGRKFRVLNVIDEVNREALGIEVAQSLQQVKDITEEWLHQYHHESAHDALGGVPPCAFIQRLTIAAISRNQMSA